MNRLTGIVAVLVLCGSAQYGAAGLVGYWPFNGTGDDASGVNIDLNLVGDADYGTSVHSGLGNSLALDGDGDAAIGTNFVKVSGNNATISAWVYATTISGNEWDSVLKNWGTTVGGQFHLGMSIGTDKMQGITGTGQTVIDPGSFPVGQWVHVAWVLDSDVSILSPIQRIYLNGVQVATAAYSGTLPPGAATGLGIGHKPNDDGTGLSDNGPGAWNGRIDDVGIFDEVLSDGAILAIYQNGLQGIQLDGTTVPEPSAMVTALVASFTLGLARRRGKARSRQG
jgi:hypothetical protein